MLFDQRVQTIYLNLHFILTTVLLELLGALLALHWAHGKLTPAGLYYSQNILQVPLWIIPVAVPSDMVVSWQVSTKQRYKDDWLASS